jgi:hypothetical protein
MSDIPIPNPEGVAALKKKRATEKETKAHDKAVYTQDGDAVHAELVRVHPKGLLLTQLKLLLKERHQRTGATPKDHASQVAAAMIFGTDKKGFRARGEGGLLYLYPTP